MPPKRKAKTTVVAVTNVDFAKLTVAGLKAECQQRSLDITGKKAELLKRYIANLYR